MSTEMPGALHSTSPAAPQCTGIRPATPADYWAIADMHCSAFYPRARLTAGLLRLDRVFALQMGEHFDQQDNTDRFCCLVAEGEASAESIKATAFPVVQLARLPLLAHISLAPLLMRFLPAALQEGFGLDAMAGGTLGAVVVDTMGEHLPPRKVEGFRQVGHERRKGIAYLSNLAVAPFARRAGIASRLLSEAEALAFGQWGCHAMALHVDPANAPAFGLYRTAGYRVAQMEPRWVPWLQGRPGVRLALMLKVVPSKQRRAFRQRKQ